MNILRISLLTTGISLLVASSISYFESKGYSEWASTTGKLEFAFLQNASSPTVAGASDWGNNIGKVKYTYKVTGETFVSNRIMPLQSIFLPRNIVTTLEPGPVTIYYDPESPENAYIYAIVPVTQLVMLISASLFTIILGMLAPSLFRFFANAVQVGQSERT